MPNTPVWGNSTGTQIEVQDFVTKINPAQGDPAIIRVNDVNNNVAARPAIFAKNSNNGADARALVVEGKASIPTIVGGTWVEDGVSVVRDVNDVPALDAVNRTTNSGSRALRSYGTAECVGYEVGNANTKALIVRNASTNPDARAMVVTGKSEIPTIVGNTAITGTLGVTGATTLSSTLGVTGATTLSSTLGVTGAATLAGTLKVSGAVTVGPNNAAGRIDAVPTDAAGANLLEIGGQITTGNVKLGRANQSVDAVTQLRMLNSNAMVVNGALDLAPGNGGAGFVFNAVGWGNGASIDFYFAGVMTRWVDTAGWH